VIGDVIHGPRGAELEAKLLEGLNPEQREAVISSDGPNLLVAVAGSGKTHALVRKVAYLVGIRGIDPGRVLAVTFSRKGAEEMNERLKGLLGPSQARVGTFHSLALQILKTEVGPDWNWKIDDTNRYRICLKDAVGYKELNWKAADVTILESFVGFAKCILARPDSPEAADLAEEWHARHCGKPGANPHMLIRSYFRAEELRHERLLLTFDDMLFDAVEMLRDNEDVRSRWAMKWSHVLQDEAQDQNAGQLLMGELLALDHRNYTLVGDPAQTIFTFRGAQPEKLLGFQDTWNAKVTLMGRNYRSGSKIIDAANKSLEAMDPSTRLDVKMICERDTEGEIKSASYEDLDAEGENVASQIASLLTDGHKPRDIAILYRTNAQSRAPEECLIAHRIPYRIIGGTNFYERREVKNLLSYLRLSARRGTLDDMARCINTPFRFLGRAYTDKVKEAAKTVKRRTKDNGGFNWEEVIDETNEMTRVQHRQKTSATEWAGLIEEMHNRIEGQKKTMAADGFDALTSKADPNGPYTRGLPARILEDVVRWTRYSEWLQKDEGEESTENSRVSNVREMVRAAERFQTVDELLDYVDKTIKESKRRKGERDPNRVTLSSLHRSKGLEWKAVFVVGCSEGILPHGRAEEPEEERRLFYVGVTRARDFLHLSAIRTAAISGRVVQLPPSGFLHEIGMSPLPRRHPDDIGDPEDV
jgi:DNA helicase-2/ATP-dependent DNA helicase PcrA